MKQDRRQIRNESPSLSDTAFSRNLPASEREHFDHRFAAEFLNSLHSARGDFDCKLTSPGPKFYSLGMFPYPSGNAHMGHVLVYSVNDVRARLAKLEGHNVLNPLGWDAFGLPAENAARRHQVDPETWTRKNISVMRGEHFRDMGWSFDLTKEIATCDPIYYANTQRLFLRMLEKGLAYRGEGVVNWDPVDKTVLANEQVIDGMSWRSGAPVERRWMKQWYFRLSSYSERLWRDLDKLNKWPGAAIAVQRNWINRTEGHFVTFELDRSERQSLRAFTIDVQALSGCVALVVAPEHPIVRACLEEGENPGLRTYAAQSLKRGNIARASEAPLAGFDTGLKAIHPLSGKQIPILIGDYFAGDSEVVRMCTPQNDQRDFDFAACSGLDTKPESVVPLSLDEHSFIEEGITYGLRDWSVGRQRIWGCPIPVIYCDDCGTLPSPELPVILPKPQDPQAVSLADLDDFVNTSCPCCKGPAKRETDTLDTFVDSAWYAFRFLDPQNSEAPFDPDVARKWMPVDYYVGAIEHAAQHLIYFRFFTKVLFDLGLSDTDEPVTQYFSNGFVKKDGHKMSKSKGNVVVPTEVIEKYGGDALRMYILSDMPADQDREWEDRGVEAKSRFVDKCYITISRFLDKVDNPADCSVDSGSLDQDFLREFYVKAEAIRSAIKEGQYHSGIARIYEASALLASQLNACSTGKEPQAPALYQVVKDFLIITSPFMPYMTEMVFYEHFSKDEGIYNQKWPQAPEGLLTPDSVAMVVYVNGKKRAVLNVPEGTSQKEVQELTDSLRDVSAALEHDKLKKIIFVKDRLINYVFNR